MEQLNPKLEEIIHRAGFSNTYERVRLERLIWLTALEISALLPPEQWAQVRELLAIPDDVQQRKNFNYLTKTRADQPEAYLK